MGDFMNRLSFDVPDYKKVRVIIDTDAACEADDPFAIVHALLSPKLIVKGILAEHFNGKGTVQRSFDEIITILNAINLEIPVFMGEEFPLDYSQPFGQNVKSVSAASDFIINEALKNDEKPLFVLCQGAITNVAAAIMKAPDITKKMTIIWIGTHGLQTSAPFREFNAGNDIAGANFVLSSGADIWLVPSDVYCTITVGLAELQKKVLPCGKIGKHLFEQIVDYNNSEFASWTQGESWSLGDSPAIAIAINPGCGKFIVHNAPFVNGDTSSSFYSELPKIRIYTQIDSRYILEDFFAKLELCCLEKKCL